MREILFMTSLSVRPLRLVILQRGEYSFDFVDKALQVCCFARYCFSPSVDTPFNLILLTSEQSFELSFSVHVCCVPWRQASSRHDFAQCEVCRAKNKAFYSPATKHGRRVTKLNIEVWCSLIYTIYCLSS